MRSPSAIISYVAVAGVLASSWGFRIEHPQTPRCAADPASRRRQRIAPSGVALRYSNWEAFGTGSRDPVELAIGGPRYEMVVLPDSMVSTTLYVGNLGEFVTDEMLSDAFAQVSSLGFVPACVARKPNYESLRYGFAAFRSEEEKEAAMERLHGYELEGQRLSLERIQDHKKYGRIRVPQKIVAYAVGPVKHRRNGELNPLRRATSNTSGTSSFNGDRGHDCGYGSGDRRRSRPKKKRRTRGRYKNQPRKNPRATFQMT